MTWEIIFWGLFSSKASLILDSHPLPVHTLLYSSTCLVYMVRMWWGVIDKDIPNLVYGDSPGNTRLNKPGAFILHKGNFVIFPGYSYGFW